MWCSEKLKDSIPHNLETCPISSISYPSKMSFPSSLRRTHLFFENDMVFHSSPRVRFASSVEFQEFHNGMRKFLEAQRKINTSFDDKVLYTITSAHLNIEFCQFMQNHVEMIRCIPVIYRATLRTLDHMKEMFDTYIDSMPNKLTAQILLEIQKTQNLLQ
jgi:hypothetical protein